MENRRVCTMRDIRSDVLRFSLDSGSGARGERGRVASCSSFFRRVGDWTFFGKEMERAFVIVGRKRELCAISWNALAVVDVGVDVGYLETYLSVSWVEHCRC